MADDSLESGVRRDPITRRLLQLLYDSRKARGWTVRDLARQAGISPSYVSLIENGHKIPDTQTIERLGRALGLDERLLSAWVTVRGRSEDAGKAIEAARELMELLGSEESLAGEDYSGATAGRDDSVDTYDADDADDVDEQVVELGLMAREPRWVRSRGMSVRESGVEADRFVVGIPMCEEGTAPLWGAEWVSGISGKGGMAAVKGGQRKFWIDRATVPDRGTLAGAWAWRFSAAGARRFGRGLYRGGTTVVISPRHRDRAGIGGEGVFAVRTGVGVVLSRLSLAGDHLVLLPTDVAEAEVVAVDAVDAVGGGGAMAGDRDALEGKRGASEGGRDVGGERAQAEWVARLDSVVLGRVIVSVEKGW